VVPALRQLHEITRSFIKQTYQKQDKVRMYAEMILKPLLCLYGSTSLECGNLTLEKGKKGC